MFLPAVERGEGEKLAFASDMTDEEEEVVRVLSAREGVMEIVSRSLATSSSSSSRKGVDRRLEGWKTLSGDSSGGQRQAESGTVDGAGISLVDL